MNVKIKNQNLCFKITQNELSNLCLGEVLQTTVNLLTEKLTVTITPTGIKKQMVTSINLDKKSICLNLQVMPEKLAELSNMGRSRNGLQQNIDGVITSLQVDVRKQDN